MSEELLELSIACQAADKACGPGVEAFDEATVLSMLLGVERGLLDAKTIAERWETTAENVEAWLCAWLALHEAAIEWAVAQP